MVPPSSVRRSEPLHNRVLKGAPLDTSPQIMILMAGMPGAGKSTIAQAIGLEFGIPVVDKDVILSSLLKEDVPEDLAQPASYRALFELAESFVTHQRLSIVVDSPCGFPSIVETAQRICLAVSAVLIPVLCSADRDARNNRVATRNALRSQPVGISRTPGYARERFGHMPSDTIHVDTMNPIDEVVVDVLGIVRSRIASLRNPDANAQRDLPSSIS